VSEPRPFYMDKTEEIPREMIPDEALYNAIVSQVGSTIAEVETFTGTLDLTGSDVKELTGTSMLSNMKGLNLTDCASLEIIYPQTFSGMALSEINLTGCTALKLLGLDYSNLDTIICEDPSALTALVSVDLAGSKFDFSEGT